jgi:hypothetical protein
VSPKTSPAIFVSLKKAALNKILIFFPILLLLLMVAVGSYLYRKNNLGKPSGFDDQSIPPPLTFGQQPPLLLKCLNLKNLYYLLGTLFWAFTLFFITMAISESKNEEMALSARSLIDGLTNQSGWKYSPFVFMGVMLYFVYNRTKITWENGVLIAGKPRDILYFDIKKVTRTATLLYLLSKDKQWILVPGTSEEMKKFKDINVLNEQLAFNEIQIEQLKRNLLQSGAQESKQQLIPAYVYLGFAGFILSAISVMIVFS